MFCWSIILGFDMSKKMKVAFVGTPDYPIPAIHGGAIQTLVTALLEQNEKKKKFEFTVYTIYDEGLALYKEKYKETKIFEVKISWFAKIQLILIKVLRRVTKNRVRYRSQYMKCINKDLANRNYDVILFETTDKEIIQLTLPEHAGTKVLYHVHADYLKNATDRIGEIVQMCNGFVAVSDFIRMQLGTLQNMKASKLFVLKNAISKDVLRIQDKRALYRSEIRKQYELSDSDIVVIYCSRLSREKGCLELEKAVNSLKNCKLLIVGGNNFSSNVKTDYVKALYAEAAKSEGRIIFTGAVSHEAVFEYMAASDIAVVPSVCNEAASLTMLEFRACSLPTIASNVGGIPEYCKEQTTLLVDYDEHFIQNLAQAIEHLCKDRALMEELKKNAGIGMEEFYYDSYYERFTELLWNKI